DRREARVGRQAATGARTGGIRAALSAEVRRGDETQRWGGGADPLAESGPGARPADAVHSAAGRDRPNLRGGRLGLRQAAFDYRRWQKLGLAAPRVAVNVSSVQLRRRDFV